MKGLRKFYRRALVMLSVPLITSLSSCGDEDRLLTVTCGQPGRERISAKFGIPNVAGIDIGLLNTARAVPGTILRMAPGTAGERIGSVEYVLRTSPEEFWPPKAQRGVYGKILGGNFRVQVDADVAQTANAIGIDLTKAVIDKTVLETEDRSERVDLRDLIGLINADPTAVGMIKDGPETSRFVAISGVLYGYSVGLFYTGTSIAYNTLKIANFYLHVDYACPHDGGYMMESGSAGRKEPLLLFYVPVYYDRATKQVEIDKRVIDMTEFDILKRARDGGSLPAGTDQIVNRHS